MIVPRRNTPSRSAEAVQQELNGVVTHRRKPRWQRVRPGADRDRKDEDPAVGIEQDMTRETLP